MLFINRLLLVVLLSVGITAATTAQAGNQLFEGSWTVKAFGNELTGGTGASAVYSAWGIPAGILCNPNQPRCPFVSTPFTLTNMGGLTFAPLGGTQNPTKRSDINCTPWSVFAGTATTVRPAKGATALNAKGRPVPPLYRNPAFFTPSGQPNVISCSGPEGSPFSRYFPPRDHFSLDSRFGRWRQWRRSLVGTASWFIGRDFGPERYWRSGMRIRRG